MANNHMGDINHGLELIRAFGIVCRKYPQFQFAFKLQYRDLDTFIHPDLKDRMDIKYIKRFAETRLSRAQFDTLISEIRANGFLTMSTSFDEVSFDMIEEQNLDIIKIASCSFTDWPVLERAVTFDKPIIASTAGASLEDMDRVISFLANRSKDFAIMHCIGEYPTADEKMHLSQIDFLKKRYPNVRIGFSTHEDPGNTDLIKIAIAKGANIFEKHVGLVTDKYPINAYSVTPEQADAWLAAAAYTVMVCGEGAKRLPENKAERDSLRSLRRGMFAKSAIVSGEPITRDNFYFAFPPNESQFTANDYSKYSEFTAASNIEANQAIGPHNAKHTNTREKILEIAKQVKNLLQEGKITVPGGIDLEISHHYGLDKFHQFGLVMLTVVNRDYCKKLLVSLPGQLHPEQYHNQKEETFHVLHGELELKLDGKSQILKPGDVVTVMPGVRHAFKSETGAVVEEISSTHFKNDSFYTDETINLNTNRKSLLTYWMVD
ncbi:spore coat protein [Polynucleobacter paneuropaeus]|nr:spore coat protein [Polynucleobacter paneuropaeus]